jgi:Xaa-Pro dipeptidase
VAREIGETLEAMIRPGVEAGELFEEAQKVAESQSLGDHFMGYGQQKAGFIGHGIGLELDELPVFVKNNTMPLAKGMIFALEPKFSFPDAGVVGVEDNFAVTEVGYEKLTAGSYDVTVESS